ncbi:MAG: DNA primase [Desulfuromonadaceae bacterium]|nr:DNA primase [Desulfuromonadaceae bacterium]
MISEEKIGEIRQRADIVEVISSYLDLKRVGGNFQGLCPFHAEKSPSFNVNPNRQFFHCFGCNAGGDVFTFLMRMEGLSFIEAAQELGRRFGIEVEDRQPTPAEEEQRRQRELLLRINEVAADFYHHTLVEKEEGKKGLDYLSKRGFGRETIDKFHLGFASEQWSGLATHLRGKGFEPEGGRKLGLIRIGKNGREDFDFFRNRLIFPIINSRNEVTAFGGRALDSSLPKYLNSPESPVYRKAQTFYGLCQAQEAIRRGGECILVEGYFDLLAVSRAGYENVMATCGTALTAEHATLLRRMSKKVLLLFDQDAAGEKATYRSMEELLKEQLAVAVITLDPGEDPDSFIRKNGVEEFGRRIREARPVFQAFMEKILREHGSSHEGKARAAEEIVSKLGLLPSPIERELYLQDLAVKTGIAPEILTARGGKPSAPANQGDSGKSDKRNLEMVRFSRGEKLTEKSQNWLLSLLAADPEARRRLTVEGSQRYFADENRRAVADHLLESPGSVPDLAKLAASPKLCEKQKLIVMEVLNESAAHLFEERERIFHDCCRTVEMQRLQQRSRELTRLIIEAEKSGDSDTVTICSREKMEINRLLKSRN